MRARAGDAWIADERDALTGENDEKVGGSGYPQEGHVEAELLRSPYIYMLCIQVLDLINTLYDDGLGTILG